MQSLTKVLLTRFQLDQAVAAAFGPRVTITDAAEGTEGWFNTLWSITLSDGRGVMLKTAPKPGVPVLRYEAGLLDTEVAVYRLLQNQAGVRVPRVWAHDPGGTWLGLPAFFMERFEDPTCAAAKKTLAAEDHGALTASLGRMNRALNEVVGPAFGSVREGGRREARWFDEVRARFTDLLADAADAGTALPLGPEGYLALVDRRRDDLDLVTEPRLVHWDLHENNAFSRGTEVTGIIDPDRALYGDPLMEICFSDFFDKASFARGYGPDFLGRPGTEGRRRVYDLYLGLVMVIEADYRGFDDGHKAWARENLWKVTAALGA